MIELLSATYDLADCEPFNNGNKNIAAIEKVLMKMGFNREDQYEIIRMAIYTTLGREGKNM